MLFWALVALIVFGLITLFVAIPGANVIYCLLGLVLFGAFTVFDFNRLRRTTMGGSLHPPMGRNPTTSTARSSSSLRMTSHLCLGRSAQARPSISPPPRAGKSQAGGLVAR